ncbi:MAG: flagellar hook-basal body complex protein FliE [Kordiimonas sp.]|nr:flagellar hook-basal body complex protein FliE [Kordiimonas sp.]|tara:strand:+ start:1376 stop:1720 length:345 start_codon:yes stop_codon:yes gene_type:complete
MDLKAVDAANAYGQALKNRDSASSLEDGIGGVGSLDGGNASSGNSFGDALKEVIGSTSEAVKATEKTGIQALNNEAELVDVITTVQNAEMVLETVVAVRDRVISAYQDIIKMPI